MKVESLIYIYIAICVSLILFNCVYLFIIRRNEGKLSKDASNYDIKIREQLIRLDEGLEVSDRHKKLLCKKLTRTANLTAFDRSIEFLWHENSEKMQRYLFEIYSVFIYLSMEYQGRDNVKTAYFPYIISKYNILRYKEISIIIEALFGLLRSDNIYCRENALKAIYSTGLCENAVKALKIIDENSSFHHPKLVCDGLMGFCGDKNELCQRLLKVLDTYTVSMQLNILNFIRFAGVRCDETMYSILIDEERNQELRFAAIRYFEKYPEEIARTFLQDVAENKEDRAWEYQAIASSALKSYPDSRTEKILMQNLSHANWYVRLNSAISCEKLGLSYADLIKVFDGEDRYAREMMKYRLDRREAEQEVTKV